MARGCLPGCQGDCPLCYLQALPFADADIGEELGNTIGDLMREVHSWVSNPSNEDLGVDALPPTPISTLSKYCMPDQLINNVHNSLERTTSSLSILHVNCRSLPANQLKLNILLASIKHPFDVLALSETWLTNENCKHYPIPGYNFVSAHRSGRGGGAGIYIKSDLDFHIVSASACINP